MFLISLCERAQWQKWQFVLVRKQSSVVMNIIVCANSDENAVKG